MEQFSKPSETCLNTPQLKPQTPEKPVEDVPNLTLFEREPLTTKKAVELLLQGTLTKKVCRYCLNTANPLLSLDQFMQIGGRGALYKVTIRDMVATFHPFKVIDDPNYPNKICNKCLNQTMRSYLFAQQCEQAERALRNCFDSIFEKLEKLDPIERKKRGRQKIYHNPNVIHVEHENVIDYAEPIRHLINSGCLSLTKESPITDFECKRCFQILPDIQSLVNHDKMHPKSMWYHCRLCGKSFPKRHQINRHLKFNHRTNKRPVTLPEPDEFVCKQCGCMNEHYKEHLLHIEKHKFQMVLEHMIERNMDKLCVVCLDKGGRLVGLDKTVSLHGGYPELTGDRTMYNVLGATVPEMNILLNYTGTKICDKCVEYAITTYVFINRTHYIRNRLDICITKMLENLKTVKPEGKILIEICNNGIMPIQEEFDENLLIEDDDVDEAKLKVDVLEDEFRLPTEDEDSDSDTKPESEPIIENNVSEIKKQPTQNQSTTPKKVLNGYQCVTKRNIDVCSEFLTFRKKKKLSKRKPSKFTCSLCNKHFISAFFLKRHVLKHINKKVECKICSSTFKSKFHLYEHVRIYHLMNQSTCCSCEICGRMYSSEQKLQKHQRCHIKRECQLCSKSFVTQKHFDSHMQRHGLKLNALILDKVQSCSFCEKEYTNHNTLSLHVNKAHLQIKPYYCDMCERKFYTELNLKAHKKIHCQFSKEKCEFCTKTLKSRQKLVVHIRKHIGIKPYKCTICMQAFYSELQMNSHMDKWHGGRFSCKQCKKVFVNKIGLKNHVNKAPYCFLALS